MDIRHRDKYIPEFWGPSNPKLDFGFFDKISLTFYAYDLFFENRTAYRAFRENFAEHGITRQGVTTITPPFPERWLFGGGMIFENAGRNQQDYDPLMGRSIHIKVKYDLELNPTQFINHAFHKYGPDRMGLARLRQMAAADLLQKTEVPFENLSLDLQDNIIHRSIFKAIAPNFEAYTKLYISRIVDLINSAIEESFESLRRGENDLVRVQRDWAVGHMEVYWELSVDDALSFVHGLWPDFRRIFFTVDRNDYGVDQRHRRLSGWTTSVPAQRLRNNAPVLGADLGRDNLYLSLYAKHYERARFEIRYKESIRQFLGNAGTKARLPDNLIGLFKAMNMIKVDAHNRFARIHKSLPDAGYTERSDFHIFADFLEVLTKLHKKHQPSTSLRNLLAALAAHESFVVITGSDDEKLMKALQREYIVQRTTALVQNPIRQRRYYLNPRYTNTLRAFRQIFIPDA